MTMLLWGVRILILLLMIRFLLRLFRSRPARRAAAARAPRERLGGSLVRDPQCGTYVPRSRALTVGHGSTAHHFCSTGCRDAWAATQRS